MRAARAKFVAEMNAGLRRAFEKVKKTQPERLRPARKQVKQTILPDTKQVLEEIAFSGDQIAEIEYDEDRTVITTASDNR
jgi:hypothetical protein